VLIPLWDQLAGRIRLPAQVNRLGSWIGLLAGAAILLLSLSNYPVTKWDLGVYENSPVTNAFMAKQGQFNLPAPEPFAPGVSPVLVLVGLLLGSFLAAFSLIMLKRRQASTQTREKTPVPALGAAAALVLAGIIVFLANTPLTNWLHSLNTTWQFFIAVIAATLTGVGLGALMESSLIRPLYSRPIYQLMLTLGLSAIGIEAVRAVWGRPEFVMPKPQLFNGTGEGCPATSLGGLLRNQCSTISLLGGRIRTYNEVFIPLVGILVLVAVWMLLQRTRIGMIIRAGVQDHEMVEALGINVRRVFTLVFALGVGLAALGGVLAGPSMGLSSTMGDSLLLNALIALAIGGLTSYPGAAAGSLMVGLMQQFIIKYGQIGIQLPFLAEPFKPTPPLVPASTVLLMVIILLILPQGLLGRKE
jgi:branched-chain amino acid transport system permease protein